MLCDLVKRVQGRDSYSNFGIFISDYLSYLGQSLKSLELVVRKSCMRLFSGLFLLAKTFLIQIQCVSSELD